MSVRAGAFDVFSGWSGTLTLPWRADAIILWCVDQDADGYLSHADFAGYTGDTGLSIGVADRNSGNQQCISNVSGPMAFAPFNNSGRATFDDRVIVANRLSSASLPSDYLVITDWDPCGVMFTTTGTATYRVYYMAFAGATLNAWSGLYTLPSDGSDAVLTGLPFDPSADPSLLVSLYDDGTDNNGPIVSSLGIATAPPGTQTLWVVNYNAIGGDAVASAHLVHTIGYTADLASFDAAGFTISSGSPLGHSVDVPYLLLSDSAGAFDVGTFSWPSGAASITAPGFRPEGAFTFAGVKGPGGLDGQISVGAAAGSAALAGVADVDDQRRWTAQSSGAGKILLDYDGNAGTEDGSVSFAGFTANGFDVTGVASGNGLDPRYAAILLSAVSPGVKCHPFVPQIYRRLPVAT